LTEKNVTTLYSSSRILRFVSARLYSDPQVKDVAEIQKAVNDELKKVRKEEFLAAFLKLYNCTKACIYSNGTNFKVKKKKRLPHVFFNF
jgi:hypothetical protein